VDAQGSFRGQIFEVHVTASGFNPTLEVAGAAGLQVEETRNLQLEP